MSHKQDQTTIIDLMIRQELAIAELYQVFSERVPQLRDFWLEGRGEELMHAQWLEHLSKKAASGEVLFRESKIRADAIQTLLEYIATVTRKAATSSHSVVEALSIAAGVEDSLLERKVFDHFEQDGKEMAALLAKLKEETRSHYAKIRELMKINRERTDKSG